MKKRTNLNRRNCTIHSFPDLQWPNSDRSRVFTRYWMGSDSGCSIEIHVLDLSSLGLTRSSQLANLKLLSIGCIELFEPCELEKDLHIAHC